LIWFSTAVDISDSHIKISSIVRIEKGQISEKFLKNPLVLLKHLSFTVYFINKDGEEDTLCLTCKDEYEFDFWIAGLKALHY